MDELRQVAGALGVEPPSLDDLDRRNRRRHNRRRATVAVVAVVLVAVGSLAAVVRRPSPEHRVITRPALSEGVLAIAVVDGVTLIDEHDGEFAHVNLGFAANELDWSPDGHWLVAFDGGQAWLVSRDGQRKERVRSGAIHEVRWLVDGATLVVNAADGTFAAQPGAPLRRLSSVLEVAARSPDGKLVAYADGGLYVSAPDGADRRRLAAAVDGVGYGVLGWSPDGRWVLVRQPLAQSASIAADGDPVIAVSTDSTPVIVGIADAVVDPDWIRWSPDGHTLLVAAGAGRNATARKVLRTCDLRIPRCVDLPQPPDVSALDPAWSSDGKQIAAVRVATSANASEPRGVTWISDADGTNARPLGTATVIRPMWTSDDTAVLELLTVDYPTHLVEVDRHELAGGYPKRLASVQADPAMLRGHTGWQSPPVAWSPKSD